MKRPLYAIALAAYTAVILALSLGSVPRLDTGFEFSDKLYHFAAYSVMGLLWAANLRANGGARTRGSTARVVAVSFVVTFVFGAVMELFQYMTAHRSAELSDAASNGAGGLMGAWAGAKAFAGSRRMKEAGR